MATIAEVRDRAASDLGMLRLGQSLQPQDDARITSGYNEVYAQLKIDGLATWASDGDIPTELVPHVATLIAQNCISTYPVSNDRYNRVMLAAGEDGEKAKKEISKLVVNYYNSQDSATDF